MTAKTRRRSRWLILLTTCTMLILVVRSEDIQMQGNTRSAQKTDNTELSHGIPNKRSIINDYTVRSTRYTTDNVIIPTEAKFTTHHSKTDSSENKNQQRRHDASESFGSVLENVTESQNNNNSLMRIREDHSNKTGLRSRRSKRFLGFHKGREGVSDDYKCSRRGCVGKSATEVGKNSREKVTARLQQIKSPRNSGAYMSTEFHKQQLPHRGWHVEENTLSTDVAISKRRGRDDWKPEYEHEHGHEHEHVGEVTQVEPPVETHPRADTVTSYYDFLINEGSYKFWAAFQVVTAVLLIYSAFAAIYYAKYTFSMMDYPDYLDDGFFFKRSGDFYVTTTTPKPSSYSFLGLSPQTFQRIMNALSSKKYS
ncbi:uncharacterized protein [Periplaneta americana]|uniref:uncharacterized protein n=1 Tax=Periplaneta americana TaxID=6978 RepID=UPI0037E9A142